MKLFARLLLPAAATVLLFVPGRALAQTDEIQVYDGALAPVGVFNLTLHTNFTPDGIKTPAFPGAVTANHSLNGVPEWAYGVTPWFEAGLYMPLYSRDATMGWGLDGFKLRALFAVPHADDRTFFYGSNFEFSWNADRWDTRRHTSEIRPIIGWHLHPVDIIINPIFDNDYTGVRNFEFVPCFRVAYNTKHNWAVAVEEYDDFGPIHHFSATQDQVHQIYGVIDHSGVIDVEIGAGVGMTSASDKFTMKMILAKDLNKKK